METYLLLNPVNEFNEFKPRLKSPKNRCQLSGCLNLEKLNTILSEPTTFDPRLKFKPRLKFFKFGIWMGFMLLKLINMTCRILFLLFL